MSPSWITSSSSRKTRAAVAGALLASTLAAGVAWGAPGDVMLASRQSAADGGAGATNRSFGNSLSRSGRFTAFISEANNLVSEPVGEREAYVYDFAARRLELVSRQSAGQGGAPSLGRVDNVDISANGRYVAFDVDGTGLNGSVVADRNVYVYDRQADRVQLVSKRSAKAGGAPANNDSEAPSISANGRFIAYQSRAGNLGGPIVKPVDVNVYVYDRAKRRTTLISRRSKRGRGANAFAVSAAIADDAPVVAFETQASNLGGPIKANTGNVYAHNWETGVTRLVSRRSRTGAGGNASSSEASISANGRRVAFGTEATNLGGPRRSQPGDQQVYLRDLRTGRTTLVSRRSKSKNWRGANDSASEPAISAAGTRVAFSTFATNLGGPTATGLNVYVYDTRRRRTVLASRASNAGPGADASAGEPAISAAGRHVGFASSATNLDPDAYTGNIPPNVNIFRFQLPF